MSDLRPISRGEAIGDRALVVDLEKCSSKWWSWNGARWIPAAVLKRVHQWESRWLCEHDLEEPHESCGVGRWVYSCSTCGEPGFDVGASA